MKNKRARGPSIANPLRGGSIHEIKPFSSNCLMITFILASIYSDVRGGAGPLFPLSSPLCMRLRDEAEGMDDERGKLDI